MPHPAHGPCLAHAHAEECDCLCGHPDTLAAFRRIEADISRRTLLGGMAAMVGLFAGFRASSLIADAPRAEERPILFTGLRLFDGQTLSLREDVNVLVDGRRIVDLPPLDARPDGAHVIDCDGRVLMPGLIFYPAYGASSTAS